MRTITQAVSTAAVMWTLFATGVAQARGEDILSTTIRANNCVANATHCHCALVAADTNRRCLKPISGTGMVCIKSRCRSGYRCDCESHRICRKRTVSSYRAVEEGESEEGDTVQCRLESATVASEVVGHTTDFHIVAYQEFQLFVNEQQVGYGESNEYKVLTTEIASGDVIAVMAKRRSEKVFGVKLRFVDVQEEIRVIDENWLASSTYEASWLDAGFDGGGKGWVKPTVAVTVTEEGFDRRVAWMWLGRAETVYLRYVIP